FLQIGLRARRVAQVRLADNADAVGQFQRSGLYLRKGQLRRFLPAVQLQSGARREVRGVLGFALFTRANNVLLLGNDFARFGFLAGLQIGVVQEVHGVCLVM